MSPVQRTMRALREQGARCQVVEKWNSFAGQYGKRIDLFGIIDIIALDPDGLIGIQACGSDFSAHIKKMAEEHAQECIDWLSTPKLRLQLWGWRKVKLQRGSKAERWSPRIKEFKLEEFIGEIKLQIKGV